MEYEDKIGDAFSEWLVGDRSAATGFKIDQAAKTRFGLEHKELLMPVAEVGFVSLLERAGIEEKKAEEIMEGLLGEYIFVLIDEYTIKAFKDGFQLAAHLLSA
ncbi:MAG: hypothetical protein ABSA82_03235 [Thermacetogeniaceae bacterium]|jgi:hypothetical protein